MFRIDAVNQVWPWHITPLVGGLIGVLFTTHAAAYSWALWDGDWKGAFTLVTLYVLRFINPLNSQRAILAHGGIIFLYRQQQKILVRTKLWLGVIGWGIATIATILLIAAPSMATFPLLVSFLLYAPWVWGSGLWLLRRSTQSVTSRRFTQTS